MFSGIVEAIGTIISLTMQNDCKNFIISFDKSFDDLTIGESVAVNGVCLTVTAFTDSTFSASAVPETLRLTNIDILALGDKVNLERSIKLGARIGGHYIQGHVEGTGEILQILNEGEAKFIKISVPSNIVKYIVNKGYVAIDGMSITVVEAGQAWFSITLIPHTQAVTISKNYKVGTKVNLETDMIAKHIEKLIGGKTYATTN